MTNIKLVDGKGFVDIDDPKNQEKTATEKADKLITDSNNVQSQIITGLESLPHIREQVEALKETQSFKDLAEALTPIISNTKTETRPLSVQVKAIVKNEKKDKKSITDSLGGLFGFLPGGSNDPQPPAPQKIYDPLVCEYCGSKLKPQWTKCVNCGASIKPHAQFTLPTWIKPHHVHALDAFAGIVTFIIWFAASGWIIQSFSLSWGTVIGLAVFWLGFIVVFRLMIGGILD